jgi:hypothetical protein
LLCDFASAEGQKINVMGGGWTRIASGMPVHIAFAIMVYVPYDQLNRKCRVTVRLMDEDGRPYPVDQPIDVAADLEVGRPPGIRPGEETMIPIPMRLNGIQFRDGGYRVEVAADDEIIAARAFTALKALRP